MAAGGRASIPAGAQRTVADVKEIAGGHTDEEVYAMLRECNMDHNCCSEAPPRRALLLRRLLPRRKRRETKRSLDKSKTEVNDEDDEEGSEEFWSSPGLSHS